MVEVHPVSYDMHIVVHGVPLTYDLINHVADTGREDEERYAVLMEPL